MRVELESHRQELGESERSGVAEVEVEMQQDHALQLDYVFGQNALVGIEG